LSGACYIDTSALAKWYLPESRSDEVEACVVARAPLAISTLTVVEMRALLARRRRERHIDARQETRIFVTFEDHIRQGHLVRHAVDDGAVEAAGRVIAALSDHPLRTLDALHLAIVRELQVGELATADRMMAAAARSMGLKLVRFD